MCKPLPFKFLLTHFHKMQHKPRKMTSLELIVNSLLTGRQFYTLLFGIFLIFHWKAVFSLFRASAFSYYLGSCTNDLQHIAKLVTLELCSWIVSSCMCICALSAYNPFCQLSSCEMIASLILEVFCQVVDFLHQCLSMTH